MPLKEVGRTKGAKEKSVKKKSVSSSEKKTKVKIKKDNVSDDVSNVKKKTKAVPKKTKLEPKTKSLKTKVNPPLSSKGRTVKKTVSKRKKDLKVKEELEKIVPKGDDFETVIKKEKLEKTSLGAKTGKISVPVPLPSSDTVTVKEQKPKSSDEKFAVNLKQHVQEQKDSKTASQKSVESRSEIVKNKYIGTISINELITVRELADRMKLEAENVLKKLLSMGSFATINQRLDTDVAILLASEFGYDAKLVSIYSDEKVNVEEEDILKLRLRPPVVTIMGHVNHGKTSLLDAIRSSNIVAGEQGGITQHIGAYKVRVFDGKYIIFLDTPGHEVFTAMRSRGAQTTDIVVLVVSATDGVMPQTIEVIELAKAANVPIIVAVNKIDLPASDPRKIRKELSNYGLIPEEWGGDTIIVDISAKQKTNVNSLLEMILLKAELMELKANPDKSARGVVIEAKLDSRKGPVATLLVQEGTLKIGNNLVIGTTYGKVKAITDEYGKRLSEAPPSTPVEILGINEPPQAGDEFIVVARESQSREIVRSRKEKIKEISLKPKYHLLLADISLKQAKDLKIILKADTQGSLSALVDALERLSTSEVSLKIIHKGAGAITESDVALAVASDALIVGFNLRPDAMVEKLIETKRVNVNVYRVIYDLVAAIKVAMEGRLDPYIKEKILGKAIVKKVFKLSNHGTVLGCSVTDGKIQRGAKARVLRDNIIVFEGNISSLRRSKDDIKEVEKGYECGICLEKFSDVKQGDIIENYTTEKVIRKLDGN